MKEWELCYVGKRSKDVIVIHCNELNKDRIEALLKHSEYTLVGDLVKKEIAKTETKTIGDR